MDETEIRALYQELQGILSQTPPSGNIEDCHRVVRTITTRFNDVVGRVSEATNRDYSRFLIEPDHLLVLFRQNLHGLIGDLHARFFSNEIAPFSGSPGSVINMSQTAIQQIHQELIVNLTEQTILKSQQFEKGSPEREFLDQFKDSLKTIKSATEMVDSVLSIGQKLGMTISAIAKILPWT